MADKNAAQQAKCKENVSKKAKKKLNVRQTEEKMKGSALYINNNV